MQYAIGMISDRNSAVRDMYDISAMKPVVSHNLGAIQNWPVLRTTCIPYQITALPILYLLSLKFAINLILLDVRRNYYVIYVMANESASADSLVFCIHDLCSGDPLSRNETVKSG